MTDFIAVWLLDRGYAENYEQGQRFAAALAAGECTDEMVEVLGRNIDIFMNLGAPVIDRTLLPYMLEKYQFAEKLINFWIANPKDTNSLFFFNNCRRYGLTRPEIG